MPPQKWQSSAQTLPPHRRQIQSTPTAITYRKAADVNTIPCSASPLATWAMRSVLRPGSSLTPASSPFPREHRAICIPRGGLSGFGEPPPHEECAGVRGDENHAFAWFDGPSFLTALDIVGPELPVHHKPPRRRVENSTIPAPCLSPQGPTSRNPSRSGRQPASSRLPVWRLEPPITFLTGSRRGWGVIELAGRQKRAFLK